MEGYPGTYLLVRWLRPGAIAQPFSFCFNIAIAGDDTISPNHSSLSSSSSFSVVDFASSVVLSRHTFELVDWLRKLSRSG
jgi:hypothetical protein